MRERKEDGRKENAIHFPFSNLLLPTMHDEHNDPRDPEQRRRRRLRHNLRRHVERQRLPASPTAEVLFVREIELILAGEVAELRRIQEQIHETCSSGRQAGRRKASHPC